MQAPTVHLVDPKDSDSLADGLSHDRGHVRAASRAAAAGVHASAEAWLQSEMERGTSHADLLRALILLQMSFVASALGQLFNEGADQMVAATIARQTIEHLPRFAAEVRRRVEAQRGHA